MPGLENGNSKPAAEDLMRNLAAERSIPIDASNAGKFIDGIAYLVREHGYRPPVLGRHSPEGSRTDHEENRPYETDRLSSFRRRSPRLPSRAIARGLPGAKDNLGYNEDEVDDKEK